MIKNVAVLFYLKKRTNSKEEKVPVYVRITCDGQRAELATGQKIQAKLWNPGEERAKGKTEAVYKLNSALNADNDEDKEMYFGQYSVAIFDLCSQYDAVYDILAGDMSKVKAELLSNFQI